MVRFGDSYGHKLDNRVWARGKEIREGTDERLGLTSGRVDRQRFFGERGTPLARAVAALCGPTEARAWVRILGGYVKRPAIQAARDQLQTLEQFGVDMPPTQPGTYNALARQHREEVFIWQSITANRQAYARTTQELQQLDAEIAQREQNRAQVERIRTELAKLDQLRKKLATAEETYKAHGRLLPRLDLASARRQFNRQQHQTRQAVQVLFMDIQTRELMRQNLQRYEDFGFGKHPLNNLFAPTISNSRNPQTIEALNDLIGNQGNRDSVLTTYERVQQELQQRARSQRQILQEQRVQYIDGIKSAWGNLAHLHTTQQRAHEPILPLLFTPGDTAETNATFLTLASAEQTVLDVTARLQTRAQALTDMQRPLLFYEQALALEEPGSLIQPAMVELLRAQDEVLQAEALVFEALEGNDRLSLAERTVVYQHARVRLGFCARRAYGLVADLLVDNPTFLGDEHDQAVLMRLKELGQGPRIEFDASRVAIEPVFPVRDSERIQIAQSHSQGLSQLARAEVTSQLMWGVSLIKDTTRFQQLLQRLRRTTRDPELTAFGEWFDDLAHHQLVFLAMEQQGWQRAAVRQWHRVTNAATAHFLASLAEKQPLPAVSASRGHIVSDGITFTIKRGGQRFFGLTPDLLIQDDVLPAVVATAITEQLAGAAEVALVQSIEVISRAVNQFSDLVYAVEQGETRVNGILRRLFGGQKKAAEQLANAYRDFQTAALLWLLNYQPES